MTPRCSVLMPAYQAGPFIRRAIASVLAQGEQDWELLIGDNASTDDTAAVIATFRDPRIRHLRRPQNVGYVRNVRQLLYEEARGELAVILCADDVWDPAYLRHTLALFAETPALSWVHTGFYFHDETRQQTRAQVLADCPRLMAGRAFHERFFFGGGMLMALSSVLFRRSLAVQARAFNHDVFHTDTALWLKLAWLGSVGYCAQPLVTYRWHPSNLSNTTTRTARLEQWIDALQEILSFAHERGLAVEASWERAVMSSTLAWCLKDAPNVKIASGTNRDVARLVRKVCRVQPALLWRPPLLARVVLACGASPGILQAMRRWHQSWRPAAAFQLPLDQMGSHA